MPRTATPAAAAGRRIQTRRSGVHGKGVFAVQDIAEGEVLMLLPVLKRQGNPLISMTGKPQSSLARAADVHLDVNVDHEACPLALAPTSSTTASLAMGDALAVALLDARGFTADDFARSHPAGSLGRRLLLHITDVMHGGDELPSVREDASLSAALMEMSRKRLGMTAVVDAAGKLVGLFTDGDLRRALDTDLDVRSAGIAEVMTRNPRTIGADQLAVEAARLLDSPIGLDGNPVFATLLVTGEVSAELLERCRALANPVRGDLTQLPGLLVARCLASEALQARSWLIDLWRLLRPALLGREALAPRIWST